MFLYLPSLFLTKLLELNVTVVIKILKFLLSLNLRTKGIILEISPILAAWNQNNFLSLSEEAENDEEKIFSLNRT